MTVGLRERPATAKLPTRPARSAPGPGDAGASPRRRAGALLALVLLLLMAIGVRLTYVQGMRADEYAATARAQRVRKIELPPTRGTIFDRNRRELAISVPARTIYANPRQIADPAATARALAPVLNLPEATLDGKLREERGFVYLARKVSLETGDRVGDLRLPGVGVLDEAKRDYPGQALAAPLLGAVGTDAEGLGGIEYAFDDLLRGQPGFRVLEQDPLGRRIAHGEFREEPPVPGSHLVLTIDRDIQYAAERALQKTIDESGALGATAIVMDPRTGEILAMASRPSFDPNDLKDANATTMRNRAITDVYEPGSVNKVVTASAVLTEKVIGPKAGIWVPTQIRVADATFKDEHSQGSRSMDLAEILRVSSNVGTIRLAQMLGPERLDRYFERFGYGRPTGLGLPGEASGLIGSAGRWSTSLPTMAIGQGLSVTPLQMIRVFATIANGGVAVEPVIVSGWSAPDGTRHQTPSPRRSRIIASDVAAQVRQMLTGVVRSGTGTLAAVAGYDVAGKTGTAQKPSPYGGYSGHVASFIGFLPAKAPELVISVSIDQPGGSVYGGVAAAPAFRSIAESAVRVLRIPPVG